MVPAGYREATKENVTLLRCEEAQKELLLEARDTRSWAERTLGRNCQPAAAPQWGRRAGEEVPWFHTSSSPRLHPSSSSLAKPKQSVKGEGSPVMLSYHSWGMEKGEEERGEQKLEGPRNISCTQAERSGAKLLLCDLEQVTHPP